MELAKFAFISILLIVGAVCIGQQTSGTTGAVVADPYADIQQQVDQQIVQSQTTGDIQNQISGSVQ